jgi:transposase InsO family protein
VGGEAIYEALGGDVPLRLVRWAARRLKERHRRRRAKRRAELRTSVRVLRKDVLWSLDATHLGRDATASKVEGQMLREGATPLVLGATVGPPVTSDDVLRLLEAARQERGGLPLVLGTDNGSPYTSREVEAYLSERRVLHLRNLPHTPQHNARVERAIGEVKDLTDLGKSVRVGVLGAARRIATAIPRLNACRLRRSLGWKTAKEVDRELATGYDETTREEIYEAAREAVRNAVANEENGRARRRKEREAILATVEAYGLILRTRGGVPLCPRNRQE